MAWGIFKKIANGFKKAFKAVKQTAQKVVQKVGSVLPGKLGTFVKGAGDLLLGKAPPAPPPATAQWKLK
jgi:hypothetical protein